MGRQKLKKERDIYIYIRGRDLYIFTGVRDFKYRLGKQKKEIAERKNLKANRWRARIERTSETGSIIWHHSRKDVISNRTDCIEYKRT